MINSMSRRSSHSGGPWTPALWVGALSQLQRGSWTLSRSIRAAVSIGVPLLAGVILGQGLIGMWISMGTLLLAAGEKDTSYPERFRQILVVTPIAASAYFLGLLSFTPGWVIVLTMAAIAFGFGILSGFSSLLSVATMQAMLVAALAIGLPVAAPYWPAALWFIVGAILYAMLLGFEALWVRDRPLRSALAELLEILAEVAEQRAAGKQTAAPDRKRFYAALDSFEGVALHRRRSEEGYSREYYNATRISGASDQLFARLIAEDADPKLLGAAAVRLQDLARVITLNQRLVPTAEDGTLLRLRVLEAAIWPQSPSFNAAGSASPAHRIGRELLLTAARLALVTGIAYAAFAYLPVPRGYWIALTVALVMKPDLGSVFQRAVTRAAGTIVGTALALLVIWALPGTVWHCAAVLVLAGFLPWASARSYALKAVVMTPMIILMINVVAPAETASELAAARIIATLIGGVIVVVFGYLIWPSSRHPNISHQFGKALEALAAYSRVVAQLGSVPRSSTDQVTAARRNAYGRLSDVSVSVQRTLAEPPPAGAEASAWLPALAAADRVADRLTDCSARISRPATPPDEHALLALAQVAELLQRPRNHTAPALNADALHDINAAGDPLLAELIDGVATVRESLAEQGHKPYT